MKRPLSQLISQHSSVRRDRGPPRIRITGGGKYSSLEVSMYRTSLATIFMLVYSGVTSAGALNNSPTSFTTESGVDYGVSSLLQYDFEHFSNDTLANGSHRFMDRDDWRRAGFGLYVRKKDVYDAVADYDFKAKAWLDTYFRITTAKAGAFRLGQFRTPVGMDDGATSSGATTFLERALPEAAINQGRRIGADWTYARNGTWLFNLAAFSRGDLNGHNKGNTFASRIVLTPMNDADNVLHFGLSASRERRTDRIARLRNLPEAAITDVRLVDSGSLTNTGAIDRYGVEAALRCSSWLVQGEWLGATADRDGGLADFHAKGGYVQVSWMVTDEIKPYRNGGFSNPSPQRAVGALELALRYSTLALDDASIAGGKQQDWTLGVNWYLGQNLKMMANYIRVQSDRRTVSMNPNIVEMRLQFAL